MIIRTGSAERVSLVYTGHDPAWKPFECPVQAISHPEGEFLMFTDTSWDQRGRSGYAPFESCHQLSAGSAENLACWEVGDMFFGFGELTCAEAHRRGYPLYGVDVCRGSQWGIYSL